MNQWGIERRVTCPPSGSNRYVPYRRLAISIPGFSGAGIEPDIAKQQVDNDLREV